MNDAIYTPAQASAVADLPLKAVHKLIDSRLIRPSTEESRPGDSAVSLTGPVGISPAGS
jgi:hypothetical protein